MSNTTIHRLMAAILADVSPVSKGRRNTQQNYAFRGIDQVAEMIHPLLAKHGVVMLPHVVEQQRYEYETRNGGSMHVAILTIDWHFVAPDGSEVVARTVGEGADSGDKATNKAMTAAQKYALTLAFCIPYEGQDDGDLDSPEPRREVQAAPSAPKRDVPVEAQARGSAAPPSRPRGAINEKQGRLVWARTMAKAEELGVEPKLAEAKLRSLVHELGGGVESSRDFPAARLDDLLASIAAWTAADFGPAADEVPF